MSIPFLFTVGLLLGVLKDPTQGWEYIIVA